MSWLLGLPVRLVRAAWREVREGGLPLFARELTELAGRKRTYVTRVVYAVMLFWLGLVAMSSELSAMATLTSGPFSLLGGGERLFSSLLLAQMAAVHVFMPALGCAAITVEKERNTLGLLFLTRLGPWRILFEKLCSRLLPMLSCLLLSVPILALAYSFGGLDFNYMVNGLWLLFVTCVQVGTLTLLCSVWCRTTTGAFVWAYLLQIAIFILGRMMHSGAPGPAEPLVAISGGLLWMSEGYRDPSAVCGWDARYIYLSTIVFFCAARFFLIRRAWVTPRNLLRKLFGVLDRFFVDVNDRYAKGVVLIKDGASLPGDEPIAWREVTKKSLGTMRYLVRALLVLEGPTLTICLMMIGTSGYGNLRALAGLVCVLWVLAVLIVSTKSSGLIATERSSETLDVLLTTTLTAREIIDQKRAGVRRVMIMVSIPLLTVLAFSTYFKDAIAPGAAVRYFLWGAVLIALYLPLTSWVSIWVGLRTRSQFKSIFASLAVIFVWCMIPVVLYPLMQAVGFTDPYEMSWRDDVAIIAAMISGPSIAIGMNEFGWSDGSLTGTWVVGVLAHTLFYGGLLLYVRWRVLATAGRRLGRGEPPDPPVTVSAPPPTPTALEPSHVLS